MVLDKPRQTVFVNLENNFSRFLLIFQCKKRSDSNSLDFTTLDAILKPALMLANFPVLVYLAFIPPPPSPPLPYFTIYSLYHVTQRRTQNY